MLSSLKNEAIDTGEWVSWIVLNTGGFAAKNSCCCCCCYYEFYKYSITLPSMWSNHTIVTEKPSLKLVALTLFKLNQVSKLSANKILDSCPAKQS